MSGCLNSQTSSRAHLAVARGDRGSSRQTGWTVQGEGWEAEPAGWGRAWPCRAEEGTIGKPLKDLPIRPELPEYRKAKRGFPKAKSSS